MNFTLLIRDIMLRNSSNKKEINGWIHILECMVEDQEFFDYSENQIKERIEKLKSL